MAGAMSQLSKESLQYIINHVVLPPRLPQSQELPHITEDAENHLVHLTLDCVEDISSHCAPQHKQSWISVQKMLSRMTELKVGPRLPAELTIRHIKTMRQGDSLPVRIRAQNAAIIFRHTGHALSLECFELSPRPGDVVSWHGALIRTFPAHAVAIPLPIARDATFLHELFQVLSRLDCEIVEEMMPKSKKAGGERVEPRDTAHPGLITEMIMTAVASVGTPVRVLQIEKRCHDDALWDSAYICWRRSTMWLLLRVSIISKVLVKLLNLAKVGPQLLDSSPDSYIVNICIISYVG